MGFERGLTGLSPRLLMLIGLSMLVASILLSMASMLTYYSVIHYSTIYNLTTIEIPLTSILENTDPGNLVNITLTVENIDTHIARITVFNRLIEYSEYVKPGEVVVFTLDNLFYNIMASEDTQVSINMTCIREEKPFLLLSLLSLVTFTIGTVVSAFYVYLKTLEKMRPQQEPFMHP
ncbi:hypothetical protein [Desulfurococcus amylolyticus]|nr:hypothetical protein [Desulfurococcus amylolyticus]